MHAAVQGLPYAHQVLKLSDNEIASLPPLRGLFNLQTLDLSFNRIEHLSSLLSLRPCRSVHPSNTPCATRYPVQTPKPKPLTLNPKLSRYLERLQANDNPCSALPPYRPLLAALLPLLSDLDSAPLPAHDRESLRALHFAADPSLAPAVVRLAPHHLASRMTHPRTGVLNWRAAEHAVGAAAWRRRGGRELWHEHGGWRWEVAQQCSSRTAMTRRHRREEHMARRSGGKGGYAAVLESLERNAEGQRQMLEAHHAAHAGAAIGRMDVWRHNEGYAKRMERALGGAARRLQASVRARLAQRAISGGVIAAFAARWVLCGASSLRLFARQRVQVASLQGALRRALHQGRVRRALEVLAGANDSEEDYDGLVEMPAADEFWREGPGEFEVDLDGGAFEEFGEEDAEAACPGAGAFSGGGGHAGRDESRGRSREEEVEARKAALTARIVELGGLIRHLRQDGAGRAELQVRSRLFFSVSHFLVC